MPSSLLEGGERYPCIVYYLAMETNAMGKAMATAAILIIIIILINGLTNWLA